MSENHAGWLPEQLITNHLSAEWSIRSNLAQPVLKTTWHTKNDEATKRNTLCEIGHAGPTDRKGHAMEKKRFSFVYLLANGLHRIRSYWVIYIEHPPGAFWIDSEACSWVNGERF